MCARSHERAQDEMALCIDFREKGLIHLLKCLKPTVASLAVGDINCSYEDNIGWVMERKTADDLATSIIDGRWVDQTARLMTSGYRYVFFVVEGDLSSTNLPHETLLGACLNAELRPGSHLIRSACIEETVLVIKQLVTKLAGGPPGIPSGIQPKSKRKRDEDTVCIRILMCIPSISERIARLLMEHFGNLRELQEALDDIDSFPKIRLDERSCIGKTRLNILARYLT